MLNYLTSIFPIVLYVILLTWLDSFRIVKVKMLVVCLILGFISCALSALIVWNMSVGQCTCFIEEILKGAAVLILVMRKRIVFFVEALVYGATIGSGFALAENIVYLLSQPSMLLGTALFRGLSTALLHMGCTALMAITILETKYIHKAFVCILLPLAIHFAYNMMLLEPLIQIVVTILAFLTVFIIIGNFNERKIYQWMDHSITFDIQLLSAIRQGKLADTKAGIYLQGIKEQFEPEVFFDVICFMQLYLELVVAGKSRMLLEQEGLALALTEEEIITQKEKVAELHQLRNNIGKLGEYLLRPIITIRDQDIRVFMKK